MIFKLHDRVKLVTDRFKNRGIKNGDIGYIVDIYNENTFDVEFYDQETGITITFIVANSNNIILDG